MGPGAFRTTLALGLSVSLVSGFMVYFEAENPSPERLTFSIIVGLYKAQQVKGYLVSYYSRSQKVGTSLASCP